MGDPDHMLSFYAEDAILHPTVSNEMRVGHVQIRDYFTGLEGSSAEQLFIEPMHIRIYGDMAVNTGFYTVQLSPEQPVLTMRYSFVYRHGNEGWKIIDHHSSQVPD
jgi:uncharacterized protein (TIGR02246 family)